MESQESTARQRTKGERYESLGFAFCRTATVILLAQKFALPVAAGAAAILYLLAYVNGQRDTRCILRRPLLIAAFWGVVCLLASYPLARPFLPR
jgi:hypothetical protein